MNEGRERHFGYKDHMNVDNKTKLIMKYSASSASHHDYTELENLIDETDKLKCPLKTRQKIIL